MNVLERKDENCADVVYNIIENEMSINAENIQFYAAHRVGSGNRERTTAPNPPKADYYTLPL